MKKGMMKMTVKEVLAIRERMSLKMAGMSAQQINEECKGADEFQALVDQIRREREMVEN